MIFQSQIQAAFGNGLKCDSNLISTDLSQSVAHVETRRRQTQSGGFDINVEDNTENNRSGAYAVTMATCVDKSVISGHTNHI